MAVIHVFFLHRYYPFQIIFNIADLDKKPVFFYYKCSQRPIPQRVVLAVHLVHDLAPVLHLYFLFQIEIMRLRITLYNRFKRVFPARLRRQSLGIVFRYR